MFRLAVCAALLSVPALPQPAAKPALYNTVKQKLLEGKQVFSYTQSKFDIAANCEAAKHYDYTWYEMQHSTLEFKDIEAMIAACPHAGAIPMIRLPDAQEWHIQHATDIGVLGIVVPTVDDVDRAREAAKWARYPPVARRSSGQGQARTIWGKNAADYAKTFNDNMLVVVMIETPTGVANAYDIASVPGIDVVIIGNNDLSVFSGFAQDDDRYQAMIRKVHDDTLRAGKIFGQANATYAKGHPLSEHCEVLPERARRMTAGSLRPAADEIRMLRRRARRTRRADAGGAGEVIRLGDPAYRVLSRADRDDRCCHRELVILAPGRPDGPPQLPEVGIEVLDAQRLARCSKHLLRVDTSGRPNRAPRPRRPAPCGTSPSRRRSAPGSPGSARQWLAAAAGTGEARRRGCARAPSSRRRPGRASRAVPPTPGRAPPAPLPHRSEAPVLRCGAESSAGSRPPVRRDDGRGASRRPRRSPAPPNRRDPIRR